MATQATQSTPNLTPLQNGQPAREKLNITRPRSLAQRILATAQVIRTTFTRPWSKFQTYRSQQKEIRKPPEKSVPFTLSYRGLGLLLSFEILILIAITTIWILTTKRNGFVDAPDTPASFTGTLSGHDKLLWGLSLFWTFFPSLIVSLCGALFAATLLALQDCQPTIELRSPPHRRLVPQKSKAKVSILLDYRRYWFPFEDSCHAFLNKHYLIGACTIVKWLFVATGPLASAIISVGNVPSSKNVQVTITKDLINSRDESWWSSARPSFDDASAILLNNASTLPWSTPLYSVIPFSTQSDATGNLTANTTAYFATLDCISIDPEYLLSIGNITKDPEEFFHFNFVDRGCEIESLIYPSADRDTYSPTSYFDCPYEANRTRLVLMTGNYDASSTYLLSNFSLISCLPNFWKSRSRVSALWGSSAFGELGKIVDIVPDVSSVERWWPEFWQAWMRRIPQYEVSDPQKLDVADHFGFVVYSYAKKSNTTVDFVQAMNHTFSVLFAAFATSTIYTPLAENITLTGELSQPGNRLFVVFLPASVVTFVMALSLLATIWVAVYASIHRPIIKEHMDLILGQAILLHGNDGIGDFINTVRADLERQARVAITAANAKKARKARNSRSLTADREREVEAALRNGDLVRYAEDFGNFKDWNCWVEGGRLKMESP